MPVFELNTFEVRFRQPGLNVGNVEQVQDDWYWLPGGITIDSGAAESVMPATMCPNYPAQEGQQKKMGVYYVAANGDEMDNEGEKHLHLTTPEGAQRGMTFQLTNVHKMLGSVSRLCQAGQSVVFNPPGHPDGSYILDLHSGATTPLREENGVYKLDAWVNPYRANNNAGFPRQEP